MIVPALLRWKVILCIPGAALVVVAETRNRKVVCWLVSASGAICRVEIERTVSQMRDLNREIESLNQAILVVDEELTELVKEATRLGEVGAGADHGAGAIAE